MCVCVLGGRKDCTSCVWLQNQFCSWVTPYSNPTPLHLSAPYTLHRGPYPLPLSTHSSSHKERWFTLSLSEGLFAQVFVCVQSGYYTLHPTPYTLQVKSL